MATKPTALTPFAEFTASMPARPLPDAVLHAAKRCVLDWFGVTLPGGAVPPASLMLNAYSDVIGRGSARLYPSGRTTDARTAALINGAASHTIEFDDIYRDGIYHPGVPVISAALAVAEARRLSGEALLRGVIAGYEVSNRIAAAVNPAHYAFWHTTGTVGTFGAAAAAAALLGCNATQALHALANAGTLAAGLQQAFRAEAMAKPMHGGHAADTGVMTALAAKAGVTGAADILDGERGFGAAMCKYPDWDAAAQGLGEDWTVTRITVKNHSACGHAHAAIDAAMELQAEHKFAAGEVERIDAGSYGPAVEIVGSQTPTTEFEAKFSLPYCVAAGLSIGTVRMAAFTPERISDPDILALAKRVFVSKDEACDRAFPKKRSATVRIALKDGRTLERHAPTRKGDPDAPLSDADLSDKFRDLAGAIIGNAAALELEERVWALDRMDSVADLWAGFRDAAE
ncbi:MAG: MmgE/PrpD family protein [Proteobacteria bacterium]|nr:MmgE/PrpD family protein [Pseudomonadota bacterium]